MARNADVDSFFALLFAAIGAAAAVAALLLYLSWKYLTGPTVGAGVALAAALWHVVRHAGVECGSSAIGCSAVVR